SSWLASPAAERPPHGATPAPAAPPRGGHPQGRAWPATLGSGRGRRPASPCWAAPAAAGASPRPSAAPAGWRGARETSPRRPRGGGSGPPAGEVEAAVAAIAALLRGEESDLSDVALDMQGVPEFERRVYEAARAVPRGRTQTYGEIARRIGEPRAAREVGQ